MPVWRLALSRWAEPKTSHATGDDEDLLWDRLERLRSIRTLRQAIKEKVMHNQESRRTVCARVGDAFGFFLLVSIIAGLSSCTPAPGKGFAYDDSDYQSGIEPASTCFDFQKLQPTQNPQKTFTFPAATIEAAPGGRIITRNAPANAHPWVPKLVHYLQASDPYFQTKRCLTIAFKNPVKWVKVSMATGETNEFKKPSLEARIVNSSGHGGKWMAHKYGSTVASMVFGSNDSVKKGAQWYPAGDIQRVEISSVHSNIDLWQVCYWR